MRLTNLRPWRGILIVGVALLLSAAGTARGATVTAVPVIVGDPTPGFELTASPGRWTPSSAPATYDWLRCDASGEGCAPVARSCERNYTVRDADLGHTLRARLTVAEPGQPRTSARSDPTAVVMTKPLSGSPARAAAARIAARPSR